MEDTDKEPQEIAHTTINTDTQDSSESATQINTQVGMNLADVAPLNEGNVHSDSAHLDKTETKNRLYPDLSGFTSENVNPCDLEQTKSYINKDKSNNVDMGCVSNKEGMSEPETEQNRNDKTNTYTTDMEGGVKETGEKVEKDDQFVNQDEVCRPKTHMGNPIVSSFSAGNPSESDISTAISERTGDADHMTGSGDITRQDAIPGRAVRLKHQNAEGDFDKIAACGKDNLNGKHTKDKEMECEKKDDKFRGIDQKWKTNYDDAYDEAHEKYEYFWRKPAVCSQWTYSVFFVENNKFTTAEQYMMYRKAILFGDCAIANKILKEKDPRRIKSLGRKVHDFTDEVWNAHCLHIVKEGNIAKFSQNKHMKETLFSTYPKILVEASPMDPIWGIGLVHDDERAWDENNWEGKNYLGYILTEVRDELMAEAGIIGKDDKKVYLPTLLKKMETEQKLKAKHYKHEQENNKEETEFKEKETHDNAERLMGKDEQNDKTGTPV